MTQNSISIEELRAVRRKIESGNTAHTTLMVDEMISNARWIADEINLVESLIDFCAEILRYSQPPVNGSLDIRWWKTRSKSDIREPILVRWSIAKTGKSAGKVAVPKVLKNFTAVDKELPNWLVTQICLNEASKLIDYWQSLISALRNLKADSVRRKTGFVTGGPEIGGRDMKHKRIELIGLRQELVEKLGKQGYDIPDEFTDLVPRSVRSNSD